MSTDQNVQTAKNVFAVTVRNGKRASIREHIDTQPLACAAVTDMGRGQ